MFSIRHHNSREEIPTVSVWVLTYNHELYINCCLASVFNQTTDFNYELVIGDDCSSDATSQLIDKFIADKNISITKIRSQKNFWDGRRTPLICELFNQARGKYIALLEGDDYWTDPYKLQKQVDYLEANPDCSICTHWVKTKDESGQGIHEDALTIPDLKEDIYASDLFHISSETKPILGAAYHPSSWVFRQSLVKEIPSWNIKISGGDDVLFTTFLRFGFCHRISEFMSTYRINKSSSWSPLDIHQKGLNNLQFLLNVKKNYQEYTSHIIMCLGWLKQKYLDWPLNKSELSKILKISFKIALRDRAIALDLAKFIIPVWSHHQLNRVLSYMRIFAGKIKSFSPIK